MSSEGEQSREPHDLLLSSGFLAFARHAGVLAAIESDGPPIDAVVGTSSGALVGALWASGMPAGDIALLLAERAPTAYLGLHWAPWRGAFSLAPLAAWLRSRLPGRIEDLPRPFAAGVVGPGRQPQLLTSGDLVSAVVASCAIPYLFRPVDREGGAYSDGGVADRLMVAPWRAWRGDRPAVVHVVDRVAGRDSDASLEPYLVVRTPRSGASFFSLGDIAASAELARQSAVAVMRRGLATERSGARPNRDG